jgi:hypothetical protein
LIAVVPPLHGRRAADGAEEKTRHSGWDDSREEKNEEGRRTMRKNRSG